LTHVEPFAAQAATVQICIAGSHTPEQHSPFMLHALPPVKQPPSAGTTAVMSSPPSVSLPSMSPTPLL